MRQFKLNQHLDILQTNLQLNEASIDIALPFYTK